MNAPARTAPTLPALAETPQLALGARVDRVFGGTVAGWIYPVLRIAIALIFLVRHADWLRPWVFLEHHRFVRGLMFLEPEGAEPRFASPILPGFSLGDDTTRLFVVVRTALSLCLLFGIRARQEQVSWRSRATRCCSPIASATTTTFTSST